MRTRRFLGTFAVLAVPLLSLSGTASARPVAPEDSVRPVARVATAPAASQSAITTLAAPDPIPGTLVPTPPMGFNNWNAFGCDVNEALMKETADLFVSSGLKDAGYEYVNIDDCWSQRERGEDGRLVPDPVKFPSGIKGVADYVHGLGLKLGIYGDAGTKTCAGYPGSLGHEELDAQTWADWGVDYLKYDNCYNQSDGSQQDFIDRYTAMREALDKTGWPIVYSICEWGQSRPWEWATGVGDLWRTGGDISDNWPTLRQIIANNLPLAPYAGPGHWNDPDMMEIGNGGMTDTEYRTHFAIWAMLAAPLIIGTDLRTASAQTLAIFENAGMIAIDQDPLGVQAAVVSDDAGRIVLRKPLAGGDVAIALYNSTDALATISVTAKDAALKKSPAYELTEAWTGLKLQAADTIAAAVPAHGTVVYRVKPVKPLTSITKLAPSVSVGAAVETLIPGAAAGTTLTSTVTNNGLGPIAKVSVSAAVPEGWSVTPSTGTTRLVLPTNASLATTWTVVVPDGTAAGTYPITLTATYRWGPRATKGSTSSTVVGLVVNAPPDGATHLSTLTWVSASNAAGPVELDMSAGGEGSRDGSLITLGGHVYTRGLGTHAASEVRYYLDGACTRLTVDVGIDDEVTSTGSASFRVYADDALAADSGTVGVDDAAVPLTADLTGASWLRLVTDPGTSNDGDADTGDATDWALPVLYCGAAVPGDLVNPQEQTIFSFEDGTEDFTIANPGSGGSVSVTDAFHTDGAQGLAVVTPSEGNWYGKALAEPLDLTGRTALKFDVKPGTAPGTTGEIAIQIGPDWAWCQGGLWTWTDVGKTKTIKAEIDDLGCPAGTTFDLSQVHAVWLFLNGINVAVDNVRAE